MMIIGANARAVGAHLGGWRHADAWATSVMSRDNSIECAKIAERGKLHFVFLADGNGVRQMNNPLLLAAGAPTDRPAVFEPVTLLSALSVTTQRIGLVATATTTYEIPYTLARKFASLDHLSGGRAGWNLVTTSNSEDAYNFGDDDHINRESRYPKAEEFADVVKGLWDSWADDAFVQHKETGQFLDPGKVHVLNHKGPHFSVRGPLNVARPPQGHPVLFSAGQSELGKELIARTADCMFAAVDSIEGGQALARDMEARLQKHGRSRDALKILLDATVYVGRTREEAEESLRELGALIPEPLGVANLSKMLEMDLSSYPVDGPVPQPKGDRPGGTSLRSVISEMAAREGLTIRQTYERVLTGSGGNTFIGSPAEIADEMQRWYSAGACDGFVVGGGMMPRSLVEFVDLVVPELQRSGIFHQDYAGATLRENLGLARPANPYFSEVVTSEPNP